MTKMVNRSSALERSSLLGQIVDALPMGILAFDLDGRLCEANENASKVLPELEPLIRRAASADAFEAVLTKLTSPRSAAPSLARERRGGTNVELVSGDGCLSRLSVSSLEDGGTLCTLVDITREHAREWSQKRDEAVLRTVEKLARIGYFVFDPSSLQTSFVSEGIYKLATSMDPSDQALSYEALLERVHPGDRERVARETLRAIAEEAHIELEFRALTADGEIEHLWFTDATLFDDATEEKFRVGIVQDITENRQKEAALRESVALRNASTDAALDCVIVMDDAGNVVEFNPAATSTFGFERDEIVGQPLARAIIPERLRQMHWDGLDRYLRTGEQRVLGKRIEVSALTASGEEIPVELAITPVDVNERRFFAAYLRDISPRISAERALREATERAESSSRAKTDFLTMMSHEIRTPLNGVLGSLGLLLEGALAPDQSQLVQTAMESGEALLAILNDLLDLSKIEAGKLTLERGPFTTRDVTSRIVDLFRPQAEQKGVLLVLDLGPEADTRIIGDAGRIRQVVLNLVSNAIKFTDQGHVTVQHTLDDREPGGAQLRIAVQDTGIGIPPEEREKLFERFARGEICQARRTSGVGLGLAISRELAELMGGTLEIERSTAEGSVFALEVPVERAPEGPRRRTGPALDDLTLTGRILLAEDSPTNALVASTMLRGRGAIVDCVSDGVEAISAAQERPYDLILMDVSMPVLDGLEATRRIRSMGGAFERVPIVAMTARAFSADLEECRAAGMNDRVTKPIDRGDFLVRVSRWLATPRDDPPTRE